VKVSRLNALVAADEALFLLGAHLGFVFWVVAWPLSGWGLAVACPGASTGPGGSFGLGGAGLRSARRGKIGVAVGDCSTEPGAVVADGRSLRIVFPSPPKLKVRLDAPRRVTPQALPGSIRPDSGRKELPVKPTLIFGDPRFFRGTGWWDRFFPLARTFGGRPFRRVFS